MRISKYVYRYLALIESLHLTEERKVSFLLVFIVSMFDNYIDGLSHKFVTQFFII